MSRSNSQKILFCVSGSIAAFKAADVVSKLAQSGHEVQVVFSKNASQFIGKMTFEGLTSKAVIDDVFTPGHAMAHIDLVRESNLMVICPASAELLFQLAHGGANDIIATLFLARLMDLKVMIYPAMNTAMWQNPLVQRNVEILRSLPAVEVLQPAEGNLACGEVGSGRLPEPPVILKDIESALVSKVHSRKRILITGGGTSEPIDSVRSITNTSSGSTASFLAEGFSRKGHKVDLLLAKSAKVRPNGIPYSEFTSHKDLSEKLREALSSISYDAVIHLAAVSDFTVSPADGKISSDGGVLNLTLTPTLKIIHSLKEWSQNKRICSVGFKLTAGLSESEQHAKVLKLFKENDLDFVVSNDLATITSKGHEGLVFDKNFNKTAFQNKQELSTQLIQIVEDFQ